MAQLSKMVIENIARKMTEKSKVYKETLKKEMQQITTEIYEQQIPNEVMKVFKSNCEYINTIQSVYLDGHGFNRFTISLTKALPATSSYHQTLKLTVPIAKKITEIKWKYEKAKEAHENLYNETISALTALRTHKNISDNLPEAKPFLPPPMSNSLVVNFAGLSKKLNKQPEVKKELQS